MQDHITDNEESGHGGVNQQDMGLDGNLAGADKMSDQEIGHVSNQRIVELSSDEVDNAQSTKLDLDQSIQSPRRPQRTRRPNVRYDQREYELSTISAHMKRAELYGITVRQVGIEDRSPESRD